MQKHNIDPYLRIIAHYFHTADNKQDNQEPTKYIKIFKKQQWTGAQSLHYRLLSSDLINKKSHAEKQ